ncbi:hypothetical protein NPIL_368911 [Nephila pilipes]|uniref:Uncharacterized protein n=1 Tax=Nephila pilipes TaxID=299642 RepID=A0A8X6TPW7_NEPPI|nr:hypothetical protein NPIL_368911 [Nephila pilipes]
MIRGLGAETTSTYSHTFNGRRVLSRSKVGRWMRVPSGPLLTAGLVRVCMALKPEVIRPAGDQVRRKCPVGSLTEAVYLSKCNAGVLRPAQRGQKPRVEQKGKCWLDPDFQYGPRKRGLSILSSFKREMSENLSHE